ncbi:cysteine hydrolase family protein [Gryllotalpicola protaetiae]|uniref:Cysteine hydrolase n=1 Tax=Gryllotalpicola protaetiae TaxID=2419771 RepID=A0A387BMT0_9MICO|nr:isochorismatase family cysteine hydrolase [Gryllotalpicola protaetiae]AYG02297.1 cysteine hydrolase [Gryllotalpicola protaetiae]
MSEIPFRYDPAHTALIVVDVQNDFCSPDGSLGKIGNDVSAAVSMVPRLQKLIDAARAAQLPVIFIQTLHDKTNDSPQWLNRHGEPGKKRSSITCRTGSWGADFYEVAPQPDEIVVNKYRYSAFAGTNLQIVLKTLGVESLLFTGVATEVCVESSLRDGLFAEYYVSLVEDCAASYDTDAHAASVRGVERNFGTVVASHYLERLWASEAALAGAAA